MRLVAEAAAHAPWWREYVDIVRNPAHWIGEFTIETLFAVCGVHALHKVAHSTVHRAIRHTRKLGRSVAGRSH